MDYYEALDFLWIQGQGGATASSGERVCAGIIMSFYDGSLYQFRLDDLCKLSDEWRVAANTVIAGCRGDVNMYFYLQDKYGKEAWQEFWEENRYRIKEQSNV